MALSGSTDISYTAGDLIKAALRTCRAIASGESATAAETNDALEALEMLIKAWAPKGLKLWTRKNESVTMVASTGSYTMGPTGTIVMDRPLDIISAYRLDSDGNSTPILQMSREDYRTLSNKSTEGIPTQYYFDATLTDSTITLWPVPDTNTATNYTLELNYRKPLDDADATSNDVEFPQEWYRAIKWNLAQELMVEYDVPNITSSRIRNMAEMTLMEAEASDLEEGTYVQFQPRLRG